MAVDDTKLAATQAMIRTIIEEHNVVCLYCSSGKDSTSLMHIARPWNDRITLLHNQVDGGWPGCTENLLALAEQWGFAPPVITHPSLPFDEYVERYGYQADIVPTVYDTVLQPVSPYQVGDVRVSSWWHCTLARQIYPLIDATMTLGADAVLTGSRGSDAPGFAAMGASTDVAKDMLGFTRYNPLVDWSTAEIYAYVTANNIPLPPHYQWKKAMGDAYEFPDCVRCTWQPEHWRLLKAHYPEVYAEHWPETKRVYEALASQQWSYTKRLMKAVMEGS